jgi:predicted RNA-binding protein with PUA-like domain
MARRYWLLKTEPEAYGWEDLLRDGRTPWDGVRNYQARNNLREMRKGDRALFYHSVGPREVVGVVRVARESYPDPTTDDERWVAVDVVPEKALKHPVKLAEIKADAKLGEMALVRNSRLSVSPVTREQFDTILRLGRRARD